MDYEVKAVRGGQMVFLTIAANHPNDALSQAQAEGYVTINAKPKK
jgi:hypothetical protein